MCDYDLYHIKELAYGLEEGVKSQMGKEYRVIGKGVFIRVLDRKSGRILSWIIV